MASLPARDGDTLAWLSDAPVTAPAPDRAPPELRPLRWLDIVSAAWLLLPTGWALLLWRRHLRVEMQRGRHGPFRRMTLAVPAGWAWLPLRVLGLRHWPVLLHVLRGDLAWVGPRPRGLEEAAGPAGAVRPGLINPWWLRRRTATHFGSEAQADLDYLAHRSLGYDLGLLLRGLLLAFLPGTARATRQRVRICDVVVDNLTMSEALDRVLAMLDGVAPQQVCFANPACVNIAARHRGYRRALAGAALVLPDGIGMRLASAMLGNPLKQNVNGTDLFPRLCDALERRGASVFLLGGQPGVAEGVAAEIARRWPALRVAGTRHGYFSAREGAAVAAEVRASGADLLLVARGVPAQDLFVCSHLPLLGVRVAMGVGGLFDFVSGRVPRAPLWMRETGLEWAWRLRQEPRRMWRRYLVGNLTFLARAARDALRGIAAGSAGAAEVGREEHAASASSSTAAACRARVRAALFATDLVQPDVPVPAATPVALLTVGHQTVLEHLLDGLALAGVLDVDLVACDRPEALRAIVGDGNRWGLRVRWSLVQSPSRPYTALARAARACDERLIVVHADRMHAVETLKALAERDVSALDIDGDAAPGWAGCASASPARLAAIDPQVDRAALGQLLAAEGAAPLLVAGMSLGHAAPLLEAQRARMRELPHGGVPGSWILRPWGAMSPGARVDDGALMEGPVLVGPGCWVQHGAEVGPGVVLGPNTLVSTGTHVSGTLVLADTYLGPGLDVRDAIVQGARIRHVARGVLLTLPQRDGLALPLAPAGRTGPGLPSRMAAAVLWTLVSPALAAHRMARRWQGRVPAWAKRQVVIGRDPVTRQPRTAALRVPRRHDAAGDRRWCALAALADIAAGHRCWWGIRPRSIGEWYALNAVWQEVLAGQPVGLLYAPVAPGTAEESAELAAVADAHGCSIGTGRRIREWLLALRSR